MESSFLSDILLIIVAAFIGGFAARTFKLPPILGYLSSGIIFGIVGKSILQHYSSLESLSQIGIALFLFTLGFEISIDSLLKINKKIFAVGILQIVLSTAFVIPLLGLAGLSSSVSILLAILFSFSSTAVVVKILEEKGLLASYPGNNIFIILLLQDLLIVPVIFFMPILFKGGLDIRALIDFVIAAAKPLIIFAAIILIGRAFLARFLNLVFRYPSHELTILATIFTASFSILALISVGIPATIAAFLAGVLISEQGKNLAPLSEIRPFRDIFLVFFFVLTGMLLDVNFFVSNIFFIASLTLTVIVVKFVVTYVLLRFFSYSPSASAFISSFVANIGEFAIVLGQIALAAHFLNVNEYNLLLSMFILSLIYIPIVVGVARGSTERLARLGLLSKIMLDEPTQTNIDEKNFHDHVVICGHGRVGREVRVMLDKENIPFVAIDFNRNVVNDLVSEGHYAIYGDPTDPEILAASFVHDARVLVIALADFFSQKRIIEHALKLNPKIQILCRSHSPGDQYELINMGVAKIIMPEIEAGLKMGQEVTSLYKERSVRNRHK